MDKIDLSHMVLRKLLITTLMALHFRLSTGQCIREPPKEIIGFAGHEVSFNCTICGGSTIFWILDYVDSITLGQSELQPRSSYLYITEEEAKSQLTFTATMKQMHNHTVSCLVTYGPTQAVEESDTVTVPVQGNTLRLLSFDLCEVKEGKLSFPPNLSAFVNNQSKTITIDWDPPNSLIQVSQYTVIVLFNGTDHYFTTNQAAFVYRYNYTSCEMQLEIYLSVYAHNPVGAGDLSNTTVFISPSENNCWNYGTSTIEQSDTEFTANYNSELDTLSSTSVSIHQFKNASKKDDTALVLAISVPTGVTLLLSVIAVLLIFTCAKCTSNQQKGRQHHEWPSSSPNDIIATSPNSAYEVVLPMNENEAYSSSVGLNHIYEPVLENSSRNIII